MREITQNHQGTARPPHLVRLFNRKLYIAGIKLVSINPMWGGISFYLIASLLNVLT